MYKHVFNISSYNNIYLKNIKMLVFDMAGTTVNEKGIVYQTLYDSLKSYGLNVEKKDIEEWHGSNKYDVLEHFLNNSINERTMYNTKIDYKKFEIEKQKLNNIFDTKLKEQYFYNSSISLMDETMPEIFNEFRKNNIKIALNTGYNKEIQENIIRKLHMNEFIDAYVSSEEVYKGRPYPYMIYKLMEKCQIESSKEVIKFGDSVNDILEGKNANCLFSIGVLSGADDKEKLKNADYLIDSVMSLTIDK